jgi:putative flavoprotein involved in K+ transport
VAGTQISPNGILDSVVVGAGQAGLGTSYMLRDQGRSHVVLERHDIGHSWATQRWDSFQLNTPNVCNTLPGMPYEGPEPDGFWRADELTGYLRRYATEFNLPVRTGIAVTSVERTEDGTNFTVRTRSGDGVEESLQARSVVVASGIQQKATYPAIRSRIPESFAQYHAGEYRNAHDLPPGAVIVVGSGQSGCQIAEDLVTAGRVVHLCTSKVGRAPRRHRGRDIVEWWIDMNFLDATYESLEDKAVSRAAQPQVSGVGRHGHTVSLQYLSRHGVSILGRLVDVESETLVFGDDAAEHVRHADEVSQRLKDAIDEYLESSGTALPALVPDPADEPDPLCECVSPVRRLDRKDAGIGAIIWATGFGGDFSWITLPIEGSDGKPVHTSGVSPVDGLYFVGFPWLSRRKSGIIYGIEDDARHVVSAIGARLD